MKLGKITYYADNGSMGDSPDWYCNAFRKYAKQELTDRYGNNFDIDVVEKQTMNEADVDFYDDEQYDGSAERNIREFAGALWDWFGNLRGEEYEKYR